MKELTHDSRGSRAKRKFTSRAVGVLVAWGIDRAMKTRLAQKSTRRVDKAISKAESRTLTSLERMRRNAMKNVPLLASGLAAVAIGVGLLAFAGVRGSE